MSINRSSLTSLEAANFCGVHPETVRRWLREGKLKGAKIGHEYRISKTELAKFWRERGGGELFENQKVAKEAENLLSIDVVESIKLNCKDLDTDINPNRSRLFMRFISFLMNKYNKEKTRCLTFTYEDFRNYMYGDISCVFKEFEKILTIGSRRKVVHKDVKYNGLYTFTICYDSGEVDIVLGKLLTL